MESGSLRPVAAGLTYAITVFGAGFALGTIRIVAIVPRVGTTLAVLLETPAILAISWWVSRRCIARFQVSCAAQSRLLMGCVAFAVLMLAEVTLAVLLFGESVTEYLASLSTVAGAIGLAAQVTFAGLPLMQR